MRFNERGDEDDWRTAMEFRILRERLREMEKRLYRKSRDITPYNPPLVVQIIDDGAKPTTVPAFFAAHPVNVGGVEEEGAAGEFEVLTGAKVYPLILGSVVPDVGDRILCRVIDGRYIGRKDGTTEQNTCCHMTDCTEFHFNNPWATFLDSHGTHPATIPDGSTVEDGRWRAEYSYLEYDIALEIGCDEDGATCDLVITESGTGDPVYEELGVPDPFPLENPRAFEFEFPGSPIALGTVKFAFHPEPGAACLDDYCLVGCPGDCETRWPRRLYITDMHGLHELLWNGGTGWEGCYTVDLSSSDLSCNISTGPVMVRYGVNCPVFPDFETELCDRVGIFMDYEVRDCVGSLGAYYLSNTKACGDTVNRNWVAESNPGTYTMDPVAAEWTFPATRLEFGTTHSPLPVSGTITLSE